MKKINSILCKIQDAWRIIFLKKSYDHNPTGAPGMLSLDVGPELSTPGSTLELGAAGMLQVRHLILISVQKQTNVFI